jgi:hypothetical protein
MTGDSMKISRIALVLACFIGLTQLAWGQKPSPKAGSGILGYLDPQTGAFRPLAQTPATPEDEDALTATLPTTGTLVFTITVTIKPPLATGNTVTCVANASVSEGTIPPNIFSFTELGSATAPGTTSTRTCTVTINYSWPLLTPTTDKISLDIVVTAGTSIAQPIRSHTRNLLTIPVPASGKTTPLSAAVTL